MLDKCLELNLVMEVPRHPVRGEVVRGEGVWCEFVRGGGDT